MFGQPPSKTWQAPPHDRGGPAHPQPPGAGRGTRTPVLCCGPDLGRPQGQAARLRPNGQRRRLRERSSPARTALRWRVHSSYSCRTRIAARDLPLPVEERHESGRDLGLHQSPVAERRLDGALLVARRFVDRSGPPEALSLRPALYWSRRSGLNRGPADYEPPRTSGLRCPASSSGRMPSADADRPLLGLSPGRGRGFPRRRRSATRYDCLMVGRARPRVSHD
jgi:hypothetical protein